MRASNRIGRRIEVAVCLNTEGYGRHILAGIAAHLAENPRWRIHTPQGLAAEPILDLRRWRGDGMITDRSTPSEARFLKTRPFPVVIVRASFGNYGLPAVWPDDVPIGRMAAEHLMDQGYRHFAVCGNSRLSVSRNRLGSFQATLAQAGFATATEIDGVQPYYVIGAQRWRVQRARLCAWLRSLPMPCGVYAFGDSEAAEVLLACKQAGLAVPEQIGVIGTNDEDLICPLTDPPLTSVRWPTREVGREAARWLDRLMSGRRPPTAPIRIAPPGVAVRRSTDFIALADRRLAAALRFARDQAPVRPVAVTELAQVAGMSLRSFMRQFALAAGRTPHAEVARIREGVARALLAGAEHSIGEVAERMGFPGADAFSRFFRAQAGMSPREFRSAARAAGAAGGGVTRSAAPGSGRGWRP